MVRYVAVRDEAHDTIDHPIGPACDIPLVGVVVLVSPHGTPARETVIALRAMEASGQLEFGCQDVTDVARDMVSHPSGSVVREAWVSGVERHCGAPNRAFWGKPSGEELAPELPAVESRGTTTSLVTPHGVVQIQPPGA